MTKSKRSHKESDKEEFETLLPLIEALREDIRELTLKNQSAPLSQTKIQMINRLLAQVKTLLKEEPSAPFLDTLESDLVPQNADAVLVLGQFKAALRQYRERHAEYDEISESWIWDDDGS
jgi:DNA repair exonuclease SbcCD ATPase subunit